MGQYQRHRPRPFAALMHEVHIDPVNAGAVMGQTVQLRFLGAPIIMLPPIGNERLQIQGIGPVLPAGALQSVRPADMLQPVLQIFKHFIGYIDRKTFNSHTNASFKSKDNGGSVERQT
ncbi:hypothetical protein D3C73_1343250 [compost metagenome]